MKFTIKRSVFIDKLNDVLLAIASRTTIPILTGLKLNVSQEGIVLTGSDADISIEAFIREDDDENELKIESTGSIVLHPGRFFADIVKRLPEDDFTFELKDNHQAEITSASASFLINALNADEYPNLPQVDTATKFTVPVTIFKEVIQQTVVAVSAHESRPILTGVQIIIKDQSLTAVATDSHRLSRRTIPLETSNEAEYSIVIPGKSLTELNKILTDDLTTVDFYITENQVLFQTPTSNFYSRLLEGNYPDTSMLIPKETNTHLTVTATTFLGAVSRASLLSHAGKNNAIKLTIADGSVDMTGQSPEVGKVEESIPYEGLDGEDIEISFNPDYMRDALRAYGNGEVKISFVSSLRPFILEPAEGDSQFVQLITPIRTAN